jgi:hypothetical protein
MKNNQNEPRHEGHSQEPSEYKSYGDYNILDPVQGSNWQFSDEDDDEQLYFPLIDPAGDYDLEE